MAYTASDKIRIMCKRKGLTLSALAEALGFTRQNMSIRLSRDTWTPDELQRIAAALGCSYEPVFTDLETGEIF